MKTIGLIGGMSWESSIEYYRIINQEVRRRLGGHHSAKSLMLSVDFAEIEARQHAGEWEALGELLAQTAVGLEAGGADCIVLCTNTMHKLADHISAASQLPFLHIADGTARRIRAAGLQRIGLLGTNFTMEQAFYRGRLIEEHGLNVLIPEVEDRQVVHRIIYDELVMGEIRPASKQRYLDIVERLVAAGAQGIILGCTEVGLLLQDGDCAVPLFDTTLIHAQTAVDFALSP